MMTREDFLNMDWNDSHIGYDIKVGDLRHIAYITLSHKYPNCLCLIADNKDFPMRNSGCAISKNPCSDDIIKILKRHTTLNRIIAIVDNEVFDLKSKTIYINYIDEEVLFETITFDTKIDCVYTNEFEFD